MSSRQFTVPTHIACPHRNPSNAICNKRVDFSAFKWYTNTNRNAKYKQILKTSCGTHWLFICPMLQQLLGTQKFIEWLTDQTAFVYLAIWITNDCP